MKEIKKEEELKEVELSDEEMEEVSGGFASVPRVPNHEYDEDVKNKI